MLSSSEADVWIPEPFHAEVPTDWWDREADKSLLIGVFKHGKGPFCLSAS
jgi:chromodomain-helicase-DNA-binding protein 7